MNVIFAVGNPFNYVLGGYSLQLCMCFNNPHPTTVSLKRILWIFMRDIAQCITKIGVVGVFCDLGNI